MSNIYFENSFITKLYIAAAVPPSLFRKRRITTSDFHKNFENSLEK